MQYHSAVPAQGCGGRGRGGPACGGAGLFARLTGPPLTVKGVVHLLRKRSCGPSLTVSLQRSTALASTVAAIPPPPAQRANQGSEHRTPKGHEVSNETTLTITRNLTSDPELRYTPAGQAVARSRWRRHRGSMTGRPTMEGRGGALLDLQRVAPAGGERH